MSASMDRIKGVAGTCLGLAIFVGVLFVPFVFIKGSLWASEHLLEPLIAAGSIALAIDVVVLLPLSLIKPCRGFTGFCLFISSYVFGAVTWLISFVTVYSLWGIFGVLLGLLFLGVGVVPLALLASLFHGDWSWLVTIIGLSVITMGTRVLSFVLLSSYDLYLFQRQGTAEVGLGIQD